MKQKPSLRLDIQEQTALVLLQGSWVKERIAALCKTDIPIAPSQTTHSYTFDFSAITDFDTHGIMLILHFAKTLEKHGKSVVFQGESPSMQQLLHICDTHYPLEEIEDKKGIFILDSLENVGRQSVEGYRTLASFFSFTGELTHACIAAVLKPLSIRWKATLYHIEQSGAGAIPIILLTSFLIGIVIAYQGATQLEKFGANIFIVEMVTISSVRELAPLLTAIVVAGRSASSYSAQIGVMKITDEVDAMRSMGFSPWDFLVLPRLFALVVSLPLLVFFADIVSVFGGMVIASTKLDVSFVEFIDRIKQTVALKHLVIGFIKAPIFGAIIATIGCFRGFQIDSSTESVGKYTTISVVNAIFWVIAVDALISVLLTEMGL
ncbi:ABC transporter permease [Sulfurospirillum cavolei]|uniref:ABC transporter permease n=1 Tax=Sulfurospirillum cavolei TaxID=366522 RepID=UPI0005A754EB|nr:MlaE family lipid ABC transporter permease subunit [Sulfurospirillum cavolei]